jgi:hypothetical protein
MGFNLNRHALLLGLISFGILITVRLWAGFSRWLLEANFVRTNSQNASGEFSK